MCVAKEVKKIETFSTTRRNNNISRNSGQEERIKKKRSACILNPLSLFRSPRLDE